MPEDTGVNNNMAKVDGSLSKFLAKPKHFKGDDDENPLRWLKRINRIRKGVPMGDLQCLTMAGSYLTGAAESWWEMVEDDVADWAQFERMFRARFAGKDKHHIWWHKIESRQQMAGETVDEVANDLKEYFELLEVVDDGIRIRHLLKALHESISYELEQRATLSTYEEVVREARKLEMVQSKYGRGATSSFGISSTVARNQVGSEISPSESASANVQSGSLSSQISALANEIQALKINMVDVRRSRGLRCWNCGAEGHKRDQCPKPIQAIDQGKDNGRH
ncbi:hypothetical protein LRAMOSA11482 [Lichtheimia ramosa]|uniref:CCHC-type domain-containing protein n=1 Tax=Lichtheimia ramosa TaxID=688394 RepID=A0A077WXQ6_9FUNG|nr:hypothetical protein LRAMOSA11482 [Lichtheimia ramosa]